jgi:hypothetical protein
MLVSWQQYMAKLITPGDKMAIEKRKTVTIGNEFDPNVRAVLEDVLREFGAKKLGGNYGVAGSQELFLLQVEIDGEPIDVEAETFVGLSITGNGRVVDNIAQRVQQRSTQ